MTPNRFIQITKHFLSKTAHKIWYDRSAIYLIPRLFLLPFSALFYLLIQIKHAVNTLRNPIRLPVPVIVVGNILVGGTGKTPLVMAVVHYLELKGYKPAVISRGYGGTFQNIKAVSVQDDPNLVGDEPLLIAQKTKVPVFVGKNRTAVGQKLLEAHPEVNVIVSDDGLQHGSLDRDLEIILMSSKIDNINLLPAGPFREPMSRLKKAGIIVWDEKPSNQKGFEMHLRIKELSKCSTGEVKAIQSFQDKAFVAMAGIARPERFFMSLKQIGLEPAECHVFPDHHQWQSTDFLPHRLKTIVVTEKDGIKCGKFQQYDIWEASVSLEITDGFWEAVFSVVKGAEGDYFPIPLE